jgi:hypothetical protein
MKMWGRGYLFFRFRLTIQYMEKNVVGQSLNLPGRHKYTGNKYLLVVGYLGLNSTC